MNQEQIESILLKVIRILIFATLLTPLILGPFGINFVEYPKAVFFRSLVEIIFVFYFALVLFDRRYLPKKSIILSSLLFFYAVMAVVSIFGVNFYRSFFGDMPRGEGLIMHLHLLAFFVIITGIFSKKEEWFNLLKASVLISGLSSLVALFQQIKIDSFYGMYLPRLSGTMSNPNLFACYIVLSIFITIFILAIEEKRNLKLFWAFLILFNCYTLFFSYTRGSWIGLVVGLISILLFNFYRFSKRNKIILASELLILCIFVLLFFLNLNWLRNNISGSVIKNVSVNINNLDGRTDVWKATLVAIKDRPILGWGFESFAFVSDKYMSGLSNGIYFDRVHNKFLELLVYGGIIGFLAYILIFVAIFYTFFKYSGIWDGYNGRPKIIYISILTGFFVAYFVQNIFAFDNIATYILFFVLVGFINNNFYDVSLESNKKTILNYNLKLPAKISLIFIVFLFTFLFFYEVNLKPTIAAMYFPGSMVYENADIQRALNGYEKGISMNTLYDFDLKMTFTDKSLYLLNNEYPNDVKEKIYEDILRLKPFFEKSIESKDEQVNHMYQFLARISEQGYIMHKNNDDLKDMDQALQKAISFNPNISGVWQLMGELKILQGDYNRGEEYIKKSCVLDNSDDAMLYQRIGSAYSKKGDVSLELKNLEKVIDINYEHKKQMQESAEVSLTNVKFIDYVASIYCEKLNDVQNCQRVYKKGEKIYPEYTSSFEYRFKKITAGNGY